MDKSSKIYVAGHTGLVGSAITKTLKDKGYDNLLLRTLEELDLTNQKAVDDFFADEKPEYVILAAAMVGGIVANNTLRADFIYLNIMIQSNVIHAAWKNKVKKLLFLGSTCIYPKNAPQPLKESYLLTSPLEYTNEPYAVAKIAGLKMCESFNIQYNTNFIAVMPTNLYGLGDNYNLEKSHVLPALMRKIHLGKCLENNDWQAIKKDLDKNPIEKVTGSSDNMAILNVLEKYGVSVSEKGKDEKDAAGRKVAVKVWGTGNALREFMYSLDMAAACVFVMENSDVNDIIGLQKKSTDPDFHPSQFINIGTGEEITIRELAYKVKDLIGFKGDIVFDPSKPDGTMRKATDITILRQLGFVHKLDLNAGLKVTYEHYIK
jgi:GDP-L-fucose synthase